MTDETVEARRFPWATVIGSIGLVLAVVSAIGAVLAIGAKADAARNPESFSDLGAVVLLMFSAVPAAVALLVAMVQAGKGWAPPWRSRTTVALALLAPICFIALVIVPNLLGG